MAISHVQRLENTKQWRWSILFIGFTTWFARLAERLIPERAPTKGVIIEPEFLDDAALEAPSIALENARREIERAGHITLEMMDALAAFDLERETDLDLHFGINTGLVLAGGIGTQSRQEYSVMGDAVNLASRLEEASTRGQILVGPDTHRLRFCRGFRGCTRRTGPPVQMPAGTS